MAGEVKGRLPSHISQFDTGYQASPGSQLDQVSHQTAVHTRGEDGLVPARTALSV